MNKPRACKPIEPCSEDRYGQRSLPGRYELTPVGHNPNSQIVGADPYGGPLQTGILVPTTGTTSYQTRYLIQLARASFRAGQRARLVGIRQYISLVGFTDGGGPFELQQTSPMWSFGDGNVSWHVMRLETIQRDVRNPVGNLDSVVYLDSPGPAILYGNNDPTNPLPPNGGRPWGKPLSSDLGNIHDLRFPWRDSQVETELDVPIHEPCDVALFASVAQHTARSGPSLSTAQAAAASPEDRFWAAFSSVQYYRIAGSLIFHEEMTP